MSFGRLGVASQSISASRLLGTADYDFDFVNGTFYAANPFAALSCIRAITGTGHTVDYAQNVDGTWSGFVAATPRRTNKGLLVESARTNVVLQNRDLTNVAWTPTNITAAKDQTGIDGVSNSASSITATAANGTILQTTTVASSSRLQSAFVKRITGTGTVYMTLDNGSTWTGITVTSSWAQVMVPTQTLANPIVGFKIETSGDAIAVDMVQNENHTTSETTTLPTSPILTTSAAISRNLDRNTLSIFPTLGVSYSLFAEYILNDKVTSATAQAALSIDAAASTNRFAILAYNQSTTAARILSASTAGGSAGGSVTLANPSIGTIYRVAAAFSANDVRGCMAGNLGTQDTTADVPSGVSAIAFGSQSDGSFPLQGYLRRAAVWINTALTNAQLQAITSA